MERQGCCFVPGGQGRCRSEPASERRRGGGKREAALLPGDVHAGQGTARRLDGWHGVGEGERRPARKGWTAGREMKQQEDRESWSHATLPTNHRPSEPGRELQDLERGARPESASHCWDITQAITP